MFQQHDRAADARIVSPYLSQGLSFSQIAEATGFGRSRCYRAAKWLEDNPLPADNHLPIHDEPPKKKKGLTEDEIRQKVATDELTVPFSNWLQSGRWVREAADPVDIYETNDEGEQVLVGQKIDPGVLWPVGWDGPKTYAETAYDTGPARPSVKRGYILGYNQEGTPIHGPAWINMVSLAAAYGGYSVGMGGGTYSKRWFMRKSRKDVTEIAPWAALAEQYVTRERWDISPKVQFAAEMNISPTATYPLTGFETYISGVTTIFPHPKREVRSLPRGHWDEPLTAWTTGSMTVPNYIMQKAGLKALKAHTIGFVIVEIDHDDNVFVRNVKCDPFTGAFYDLDVHVDRGIVRFASDVRREKGLLGPVLGIGCNHRRIANNRYLRAIHGIGGYPAGDLPLIDAVDASVQTFHDLFDGGSINHHEDHDAIALYKRYARGAGMLLEEVQEAADFLVESYRPTCETVVIYSNHDDFLRRWLLKSSDKVEVQNSKLWYRLNWIAREHIDQGNNVNIFEHLLRERRPDAQFTFATIAGLCERHGYQLQYHGDRNPNGARGSTAGLAKIGKPILKAHNHGLELRDECISLGAIIDEEQAEYAIGPSSWAAGYALVHCDGNAQVATLVGEKWRA